MRSINLYAGIVHLKTSGWFRLSELVKMVPPGMIFLSPVYHNTYSLEKTYN